MWAGFFSGLRVLVKALRALASWAEKGSRSTFRLPRSEAKYTLWSGRSCHINRPKTKDLNGKSQPSQTLSPTD